VILFSSPSYAFTCLGSLNSCVVCLACWRGANQFVNAASLVNSSVFIV
jgi:hypothetical protein